MCGRSGERGARARSLAVTARASEIARAPGLSMAVRTAKVTPTTRNHATRSTAQVCHCTTHRSLVRCSAREQFIFQKNLTAAFFLFYFDAILTLAWYLLMALPLLMVLFLLLCCPRNYRIFVAQLCQLLFLKFLFCIKC